ncbi:MAG: hypothetical protein ACI4Q3_10695 [Kiritimatiellia bacterium]
MRKSIVMGLLLAAGGLFAALELQVREDAANLFGAISPVPACGGRAACLLLDGTTLYCGANRALWIFDVRDPVNPRLAGVAKGIGSPRQIAAEGGMVYVGARETGVWIVDARDPARPTVANRFDTVELATGMDVCGGILFVGQRQNGVEFVDVRDPMNPAHIRLEKTDESQSVWYRDGWLYSGDWGAGRITTIDARDMAAVKTVHVAPLKGHGDGVAVLGRYLYAATGHHSHDKTRTKDENWGNGHGLEIFDLADPSRPKFVSRVQFPRFWQLGGDWWTPRPSADGRTVFVADTHNGLFAVETSDPVRPRRIGHLVVVDPARPDPKRPSAIVNYVAVGDGVLYVASEAGLSVVACGRARAVARFRGTPPRHPEFRMDYPTPATSRFSAWLPKTGGQLRGAAVHGDYCYAACGHAGLSILKSGSPSPAAETLVEAGRLDRPFVGDAKVKDGLLHVAEGLDGFAIYALDDPARPRLLRRVGDFGGRTCCAIWIWAPHAPYVIASNRQDGYLFFDARKDFRFVYASAGGCPGWDRYLADDVVGGRWLAQSTSNTGFKWIDLGGEKPVESVVCRGFNRAGLNDGCCAFRNGKLLRTVRGRMVLLEPGQRPNADGSDWKEIAALPKMTPSGTGQPVWDGGTKLALTARIEKRVGLYDVSDDRHPALVWTEAVSGNPDTALFWKGKVVVPCGHQGLLIEK